MLLEQNTYYHVYNQGNNKEKIFYRKDNYYYFLKKIKKFFTPHVHMVCYCLMPNHFHLLILAKEGADSKLFTKDLATCLRSYTRAINKQEGRSGSLFRAHTKFRNGNKEEFITVNHPDFGNELRYARTCFEYIHQNPVKARLVPVAEEWKYSSAKDYKQNNMESICNISLGKELFALN